jgi:hypothetical protein
MSGCTVRTDLGGLQQGLHAAHRVLTLRGLLRDLLSVFGRLIGVCNIDSWG